MDNASPVRALAQILNEHDDLLWTLKYIKTAIEDETYKESILYSISELLNVKRFKEKN